MNENRFSVSVVIPNYNGENIIVKTLESAFLALETSNLVRCYEIIVSDDASTDCSISLIRQNFKKVKIIESETNTGFSGNVNRGVNAANNEFVLILNSDLHLEKGYFDSIIPIFKNPNVFGIMGSIKDPVSLKNQDGAKIPKLKYGIHIDSNTNNYSANAILPTFFLSGANALVRRDYFLKLNGFCELFNPYYSEDVELGIRAWKMGWELYFQPKAVCYHEISSTISKIPQKRVRIIAKRNKYILHALHLPKNGFFIYQITILFVALTRAMIGKTLHLNAFIQYHQVRKSIRKARFEFNQLNNQKKLSLIEVVAKVKSMVAK